MAASSDGPEPIMQVNVHLMADNTFHFGLAGPLKSIQDRLVLHGLLFSAALAALNLPIKGEALSSLILPPGGPVPDLRNLQGGK